MAERIRLIDRARYEFDKSMAAGPIALIGWLAVVSLAVILVSGLVLAVLRIAPEGGSPMDFVEATWQALMRSIDPGAIATDRGWSFRSVTIVISLAGIFIFSTLIGVIGAGVNAKLDELRKGRSRVLEQDHTVILNWSDSIFDIIRELMIANQSRRRPRIVIMADRDKVWMEDAIAAKVGSTGRTQVICRRGEPTNLYDLALVRPETSRSVIVLSPEGDDPDSQVIKTVLALVHDPQRREAPYRIAAEIREPRSAELAQAVGGDELQIVMADELIARIVVHATRQSGLSAVYSELLGFEGSEIYVVDQPELEGKTFGEAVVGSEGCALIGVCEPDGKVRLNPPMDTPIVPGSRSIVIAEDDSAICRTALRTDGVEAQALRKPPRRKPRPERTLMLGWNRRAPTIARELSRYVADGSELTIAASLPDLDDLAAGVEADRSLTIRPVRMNTTSPTSLARLDIPSYDHVIVLGYSDLLDAQAADTRTLVTLLHVRRIAEQAGAQVNVVSEMTDVRNRELAEVTKADDFVVSNRLVSLMLAQASENEHLSAIFADLLDEAGSEIMLKPVADYVELGRPVNFFTVAEAARRRGEAAIGYCRRNGERAPRGLGGVVLNPEKSEAVVYTAADRIVVLARD